MKIVQLLFLLILLSCGKQEVEVKDSEHIGRVEGEAYQYIIVQFEFISEMKQLCREFYLPEEFESEALYNQAVAECTFEKISILDTALLDQFYSDYCEENQENYDELPPEEQEQVDEVCEVL